VRLRSFELPAHPFVANLKPVGNDEIADNTSGRTANKGMEGLAITPDGKTLVGIMQAALIQDAALGGKAKKLLASSPSTSPQVKLPTNMHTS
jgi:hypothetical protein